MMNRKAIIAILTTAVLAGPALADAPLPQQHYADELQRCIATIRAELPVDDQTALQHRVTRVSKENIWYEFSISTLLDESAANPLAETECRAWRFADQTVAIVEPAPSGASLAQLQ